MTHDTRRWALLAALALSVLLVPDAMAQAAGNGIDKLNSVAGAINAVERAFISKGNSAAGPMVTFAMKLLAGGYALMLSWLTLEWFFDGRALPALFGTFLNLTLRFCLIMAFLVPVAGTSGYSTAIGIVNEFANTALNAVGGSGFSTSGDALTSVLTNIGKPAIAALRDLYKGYMASQGVPNGIFESLTNIPGQITLLCALAVVGVAVLIALGYALFNVAKTFMYAAVAFGLGTALGPMFIGLYILPLTNGFLMHWLGFMLIAAFVKVVAAFIVGAVATAIPSLVASVAPSAAVGELTIIDVLLSCFALVLLMFVFGWVLGSIISLANAILPGRIGEGPRGGVAAATMAVVGTAVGAAVGAVAKGAASAKAARSASSSGAGASSGGGGVAGGGGGAGGGSGGGATPPVNALVSSNVPVGANAANAGGAQPSGASPAAQAGVQAATQTAEPDPASTGESSPKSSGVAARLASAVGNGVMAAGKGGWRGTRAAARVGSAMTNAALSGRVAGSMDAGYKAGFGSKLSTPERPSTGANEATRTGSDNAIKPQAEGQGTVSPKQTVNAANGAAGNAESLAAARNRYVASKLRAANSAWRRDTGGAMTQPMAQRVQQDAEAKWDSKSDATRDRYAERLAKSDAAAADSKANNPSTSDSQPSKE